MEKNNNGLRKTVRLAGLLNLLWILSGLYGMIYLPSKINTGGDAATTAYHILSNEFLFRTGIVNGVISACLWILLVWLFHRMFRTVNESLAKLLVAFVLVQIPVGLFIDALQLTVLSILKGDVLIGFDLGQRQEIVMLLIRVSDNAVIALELFWGLWLIPLGLLVYKSRFLPRFLGIWLIINGLAYVILCLISIMSPAYQDITFKIIFPAMLGEMAFMLWLLLAGIRSEVAH